GKPVSSMRRPRPGPVSRTREAPSQPSAGITTGCPRAGLHVWTMKERWPPLRIRAVMACRRPEARPQGDRKRRKWSAGRRLPPIARRKETPRKRLGRLRQPLRGSRKPPRLPALRSPRGSAMKTSEEGLPGANQKIRAMNRACEDGPAPIGADGGVMYVCADRRTRRKSGRPRMTRLTLPKPDDWHVHFRDGEVLKSVAPFTAQQFRRAIVMPNLVPPVTTAKMAADYRARIMDAVKGHAFTPLMTCYLTDGTDKRDLIAGFKDGV